MAKILLIDDDPDICTVMGAALSRKGYQVATASQREDALVKLREEKPALILLDVLLSGTDGRDLCREIKSDEFTKHIPVIMTSGHPGAAIKFEACGADDFIAKPFTTEALLIKLTSCIGK